MGDEERIIAVEEVIVLDEGPRGVEEEEVYESVGRRMGCNRKKDSARCDLCGLGGDALREKPVGIHRDGLLV